MSYFDKNCVSFLCSCILIFLSITLLRSSIPIFEFCSKPLTNWLIILSWKKNYEVGYSNLYNLHYINQILSKSNKHNLCYKKIVSLFNYVVIKQLNGSDACKIIRWKKINNNFVALVYFRFLLQSWVLKTSTYIKLKQYNHF